MKRMSPSCLALTFLLLCLSTFSTRLHAQDSETGELRGHVVDVQTNEPLAGASVQLKGTKIGAATDMNGVYTIRRVPVGTYSLVVESLGYQTKEVSEVQVSTGVNLVNIVLEEGSEEETVVVVTGIRGWGNESALLAWRLKSTNVEDGISAEQMKRSPDATSGEALQRVTGLSIVENKFVSVRGTNERYNITRIDGVSLPSTDPDRKSFSFDLFPANLLENMIVSKTYTPDLPGNFTGGLVQMNTTAFPDMRTLKISASLGYDQQSTFEAISFPVSGSTDWLGIDDGSRALPEGLPESSIFRDSLTERERALWGRQFSNDWVPVEQNVPLNSSFILSYGDRFTLFENDFGLLASISYRNSSSSEEIFRRDTGRFAYPGLQNEYSVLWGGLLNLNYKLGPMHSIGVRNVYSRTSDNRYTILEGTDFYNSQTRRLSGLYYLERDFYSGQLSGQHLFPILNQLRFEWRAFGSLANRDEPDYRRFLYFRDAYDSAAPFRSAISQAPSHTITGRYYSNLDEKMFGSVGDLSLPLGDVVLKGGVATEKRNREFAARSFAYGSRSFEWQFTDASLDTLLSPENIDSGRIFIVEQTKPIDSYTAESRLDAGYLMTDIPFSIAGASFRTIVGARIEQSRQQLNSIALDDSTEIRVDNLDTDILPSINLIYNVFGRMNIRGAFSRTVTRPEFREFAPFVFYDFTTDQNIYGNPNLQRSISSNYDFRIEYFPDPREVMAISLFYKDIENAIEAVAITGGIPERTWDNADRAENLGVEVELRKGFGFIAPVIKDFSMSLNYTWLDSKVDVIGDSLRAGKNGRRLQGQSPYIVNAGLYYDNYDAGTQVSLLFNRLGPRISEVANTDQPDFIEQPRSILDLSISQQFLKRFEAKFSIRNLLQEDIVLTQDDIPSRVNSKDRSFSLALSWKL